MKELKLLSLEIKNFQGCKEHIIEPNGKDLRIYGENEAGKSTLASAWTWLLFGKNIHNQSTQKFDIKPLDENNEPIHRLETSVKATLQINDSQRTFKKVYYEKWTKKRGSNKEVFDGHTTDCYVSGVPVKKSEFEDEIKQLANEEVFRLLTDPLYFNQQLHWKERRNILLDMQNVTTDEVIENADNLDNIKEILFDDDSEKTKKALKNTMKELNKDIEKIPTRIDEVNNNLPDVSDLDVDEIKENIEDFKSDKKQKEKQLSRVKNGGEIAEKEKELAEIETEIQNIKNDYTAEYDEKINDKKEELEEVKDEIRERESETKDLKSEIETIEMTVNNNESIMNELRQEFKILSKEKEELQDKEWDGSTSCPTCGQELPEGQIEEAKANFNRDKAEKIEDKTKRQKEINQEGKEIKEKVQKQKGNIKDLEKEIEELESETESYKEQRADIQAEINNLQQKKKRVFESDTYKLIIEDKKELEQQIKELKNDDNKEVGKLQAEINSIDEKIENEKDKLQDIKEYKKGQQRIQELEKEEEELAGKYEELERKMYLCEQYEKTRAELLEEKVNGMFDMTEFVLFEKQINGGIKPTCKATYRGVPFNTNLNDGHRILVGVDIIDTLADHYNFRAPLFIDNAESLTNDIETDSQLIELIAKKGVEELTILEGDQELIWDDETEDWIIKKEEK